jgi:hypothetical protein
MAIAWYIWRGAVLWVPISTLQKPKQMGGWGLTDIASKCMALLLSCMYVQSKKDGMVTAMWLKTWNLTGRLANPPNALKLPMKLAYLHSYAFNMAYIMPPGKSIARQLCRLHVVSPLESTSHRAPACKIWKLPGDDITNCQSPPKCASHKPCRGMGPLNIHTLSDISSCCLHAKDKHYGLVCVNSTSF